MGWNRHRSTSSSGQRPLPPLEADQPMQAPLDAGECARDRTQRHQRGGSAEHLQTLRPAAAAAVATQEKETAMKAISIRNGLRKWAISLGLAVTVAVPSQASVNLAEVPLYLTAGVQPNLMFILDDSGSMQWEHMPDGGGMGFSVYMFPRPADLYGGTVYNNQVPNFAADNVHNFYGRSATNNAVFYNPDIDYVPWSNPDGSSMADANPAAALYNPVTPALGSLNLTAQQTQVATWFAHTTNLNSANCAPCGGNHTYWPITYFNYLGGDPVQAGSYQMVQITTATAASDTFTSPNGTVRTRDQEIQNFANWFQYYRSRILAARAGIGRAFGVQGENMRVGFGSLNKGAAAIDGVNTGTIIRGVRSFSGTDRDDFFDLLYDHTINDRFTPLRRALNDAGSYYSRSDNAGPWGNTPGDNSDSSSHLSCRQSYTILMTDGFWNGPDPTVGNADGTDGPTITDPEGQTYQYTAADPYQDSFSNTLADVAMEYWKNDLRTDIVNGVPSSPENPAFWQHMVTFGVGLGVEGAIDPATAWTAVSNGAVVAWGDPFVTNPAKLDDLLHAGVNSRGGYFTASDPDSFAQELSQTLAAIMQRTESSSSSVAANSTRLDAGTLVYQARFDSDDWSGQLLAYQVNANGELIDPPDWDAGQLIPAAATRKVFTLNDSTDVGVPFAWTDISTAQQDALDLDALGNDDGHGEERLAWLRGDQTNEAPSGLGFRARSKSILGDIVNSDPVFVGLQDFGNNALPGGEGSSYIGFRNSNAYLTRKKMLYVGTNAGMLHGFDAETGIEQFAYVPKSLFSELSKLTSPDYTHRFFVNGSPRSADAHIDHDGNGTPSWRTVLVGTTGAGARSVFALDVTDPAGFGAGDVLWEFTSDDNGELGFSLGEATIARLKAGDKWVALVGNGYNSNSHTARLFILDLATGAELEVLDTGVGDASNPNGLHAPVPVDVDGDRIADFVYAGDLHGNLWKFDLTGAAQSDWKIAQPGGSTQPLFTATDGGGNVQPITVRPTVGLHPSGGVMVYFGTGKFFEVGDEIVSATPSIHAFYGIWDKGAHVTRAELQAQSITWQGNATFTQPDNSTVTHEMRVVSENDVNYGVKRGWYLDLLNPNLLGVGQGERVISRAILRSGRIIFTSMIPAPDPCQFGGEGWLMELDALSGGRLAEAVFDLNGDGYFNEDDWVEIDDGLGGKIKVPPSGIKSKEGIINTPGVIEDGDKEYKFASGSSGGIQRIVESSGDAAGRKGWWQLR
jgi:type IV pilus assembly protein PilY1